MINTLYQGIHFSERLIKTALLPLAARLGLAATFWLSGQTKITGLQIDILGGSPLQFGIPQVTDGAIALFQQEYRLPLLDPALAATLAAAAEHILPLLLLIGLATRVSALGLLGMTMVIQLFVYPDAWPLHLTWIAAQLYLLIYGAGRLSLDQLLPRRR